MTRRNSGIGKFRIPDAVAGRLLDLQPRVREPNPEARAWSLWKRFRNYDQLFTVRPVPLARRELAFWEIGPDEGVEGFLFDHLLRSAPAGSDDADWKHYPPPYRSLLAVLRFEQHRQFDGWTAVTNVGVDGMANIVAAYRALGLRDEAKALHEAAGILAALPEGADESGVEDEIEAAYERRKGGTPTFEARMAVVISYVRANPKLFAA